jgi:hypothetical protein
MRLRSAACSGCRNDSLAVVITVTRSEGHNAKDANCSDPANDNSPAQAAGWQRPDRANWRFDGSSRRSRYNFIVTISEGWSGERRHRNRGSANDFQHGQPPNKRRGEYRAHNTTGTAR